MNVALFTDTYPPEINGVATSTANLKKTLEAHGNNVIVVATNPYNNSVTYEEGVLRVPGVYMEKLYGYRMSWLYNTEAMRILMDFRPDVVHCQTDAGIGMFGNLVAAKLHIGVIYTYHTQIEDYASYLTRGHFDRVTRHVVRGFFRNKMKIFDAIISPSEKSLDYLRSIGVDSNIAVVPTGIEFSRFSIEKEDKRQTAALKQRFGIMPNDYVLLSLGRIAKEKSIDVLLRGYAAYLAKKPAKPTKFVITGWGPAEKELQELTASLGIKDHVIFTGKVPPDQTQLYYHLGDMFMSASLTETQGLTFMEAMSASLPVLARYDDNLVGTIKDGDTGFFFFDEEDFPSKLDHVINMSEAERKAIIRRGMDAIEPYSMEHFYQSIMEVYQRVCRRNW